MQAVSNSLWAYAKLVLGATVHRAVQSLPQYTSQEVANSLWALATLEHHPGVQLLDASAIQIARRMEQFSPQDTTNSVWAYAKLFHYPCNDLLQSAAVYCLRHWHRLATALQSFYHLTVQWLLAMGTQGRGPAEENGVGVEGACGPHALSRLLICMLIAACMLKW